MLPPLSGIKVIDATSALSGPYCTLLLGDLGAEVIKIEEPQAGDMLRKSAPFIHGEGSYFLYGNRNKRSLTAQPAEGKRAGNFSAPRQGCGRIRREFQASREREAED